MSVANKMAVAANASIVVTCTVLVTMVVIARGPQLLGTSQQRAPAYKVGDVFSEAGPESRGKSTLVMIFRSNCVPCRESAPFHRTLASALQTTGTANVVAVSPEPADVASAYLREHNVPFTGLKSVPGLRVRSTPSLLWLDGNGVIKHMWVGRLPPDRESQVYRTLSISPTPDAN